MADTLITPEPLRTQLQEMIDALVGQLPEGAGEARKLVRALMHARLLSGVPVTPEVDAAYKQAIRCAVDLIPLYNHRKDAALAADLLRMQLEHHTPAELEMSEAEYGEVLEQARGVAHKLHEHPRKA